jgi:cytochrome c peroxidase
MNFTLHGSFDVKPIEIKRYNIKRSCKKLPMKYRHAMRKMTLIPLVATILAGSVAAQTLPTPVADSDYRAVDFEAAKLGQLLFYDPILSGNRNIACASCHHPDLGTGDGLSLGIGEGGIGIGPGRQINPENPPEQRIPRNAQALFNLGAYEFTTLFHDGRVEADPDQKSGLRTPLDEDMVQGFASPLSAQTMFPVLSQDEMAGHYSENDVAQAVRLGRITGAGGAWDIIARRVAEIEAYSAQFVEIYEHIDQPADVAFTDISNAIASFIELEWRADQSPFDAYLRGEDTLAQDAMRGMELFYGSAGCAECHSGVFQTDHQFHAVGVVQIGPGKAARFENHARDLGRMRVTGLAEDAYAFRTPSLRNILMTGPYGHAGAHASLSDFLQSHLNPAVGFASYDLEFAELPDFEARDDLIISSEFETSAIWTVATQSVAPLGAAGFTDIMAFLTSLSDERSSTEGLGVPTSVPSGIAIEALSEH